MIDVSKSWKVALGCYSYPNRDYLVPTNDIKIEYEQIDAEAQNSATVAVNSKTDYSTEDDVMNLSLDYSYKVITFEGNAWGLNGEYQLYDGESHIGWVSQVASGEDFAYPVGSEPKMTLTWDEPQLIKIPCIIITWNATLGEFAREFTVNCYNGATLLWTKDVVNSSVITTVTHDLENYDKIEIIVTKWCLPYTRAKMQTVSMGLVVTLGRGDLLNVECEQNSDLLAFELPGNKLSFEIDNVDEEWNPDYPKGRYAYLLERQRVSMYVAYKIGTAYEWHKISTAYIAEWNTPQNGISATFTARDLMSFMTQKFVPSAIEGLFPTGYTQLEYIESNGTQYIDTGYIPQSQKLKLALDFEYLAIEDSKALFSIARPSDSNWFVQYKSSASSIVRFYFGSSTISNVFNYQNNKRYKQTVEVNDGSYTIRVDDYVTSANYNGSITNLDSLNLFGRMMSSAPQITKSRIYEARFYDNDLERLHLIPCKRNSDGAIGLYDLVEGKFYGNSGTGTFVAGDVIGEIMVQRPYTFGDSISLYDLAQNAFEQADLPTDADGSIKWGVDDSLKGISVVIPYSEQTVEGQTVYQYQFEHTNAEVIQLCASASNTVIRIDENGNIKIVPLAETQGDYLIDRFVSFSNAEYENQKILKSVLINDTWQSDIASVITGELQSIDNALIQSQSQALDVASKIQKILGKRRVGNNYTNGATLNGDYRADVRLQPLDMILNENKYALNIIYVTGVKYSYSGAWKGNYEGRVIRSIPKADTDYLYYVGQHYSGGDY